MTIPASTDPGEHSIRIYSGDTLLASADLEVTATGDLAVTGGTLWTAGIVLGVLLVIVGAAMLVIRRRTAMS